MSEMGRASYPRTLQEMLDAGWEQKILNKVKKYNLNDILNSPEEVLQDVFVQLLQKDKNGKTYLDRFDPNFRNFDVYIYTLVFNSVKKRGTREGSKGGTGIVNHYALDYTQEEADAVFGVVYVDRLETEETFNPFVDVELSELISKTRKSLEVYKASSTVVKEDGKVISRDPLTVFDLLVSGYTVPEIADLFETSKQFIYNLIGKIRTSPEINEWHEELQSRNFISEAGKRQKKKMVLNLI